MTKVEAIKRVMMDNCGTATWEYIYSNIEKYYSTAKRSEEWEAGIRGVLYREIRSNRSFKKIGLGIFALREYVEEEQPDLKNVIRMHSYIEGICIELGNFDKYLTYTADPSALFKDNIRLSQLTTLKKMPDFSYNEVVQETRRIDVVWLNPRGFLFPQKVFEVVDSVGTLTGAFNRSLQLLNFRTDFYIVSPEQHRNKFDQTLRLEPYLINKDKFKFINYEEIIELYGNAKRTNELGRRLF